jgi:sterol desaturase/sphingolipid hydroxylase (fatty acid hydroxylase superfamily)
VLYSVNGFFQHSNIYLRFGLLSGIFSTAEMHRWHHSQIPAESNSNYANVFIIWDRLFGTYYRPASEVGMLGLLNPDYPMGIIQQMKAPFVDELYSHNATPQQQIND